MSPAKLEIDRLHPRSRLERHQVAHGPVLAPSGPPRPAKRLASRTAPSCQSSPRRSVPARGDRSPAPPAPAIGFPAWSSTRPVTVIPCTRGEAEAPPDRAGSSPAAIAGPRGSVRNNEVQRSQREDAGDEQGRDLELRDEHRPEHALGQLEGSGGGRGGDRACRRGASQRGDRPRDERRRNGNRGGCRLTACCQ